MFDIFRFMMLRPPEKVDATTTISIQGETSFTTKLKDASQSEAPQVAMKQVAEGFTRSDDFVGDPTSLVHSQQYSMVGARLLQKTTLNLDALRNLIEKTFKSPAKAVVVEKGFLNDKRRIQDSLVALQLAVPPQTTAVESLIQLCRVIDLIERVGHDDPLLSQSGGILQSLNRFIVLPADLFPVPSALNRQSPPPSADAAKAKAAQARQDLLNRAAALEETLQAVNTLTFVAQGSISLPSTIRKASAVGTPVQVVTETAVLHTGVIKPAPGISAIRNVSVSGVDPQALQALSPSVKSVLADLNLDLTTTSLASATDSLNTELTNAMDLVQKNLTSSSIIKNIAKYIDPQELLLDPFHEDPPHQEWEDGPPPVLSGPPSTSNSKIVPAGIADLLVVREHVVRYEPGEIAFVENVARGELLKRRTHRKDTTENSTLTTTSSSTETQRDLQATSRFDLQSQSQSVIEQDTQRVPGMGSTDAYGPLVDSGGSNKQSASQASNYGQDITRRAVSKITESVQTQVMQLTTSEFAENVEHDFDNSKEKTDQIIVYQWLDRISEAEVFSYDKRVIYDFIVPEPATFLVNALKKWQPELTQLESKKPTLLTLRRNSLNPKNYQKWADGYGATGVQPPPEPTKTIAKAYGDRGSDPGTEDGTKDYNGVVAKEMINIDHGYKAKTAFVNLYWFSGASNFVVGVMIGQTYGSFDTSMYASILNLHQEVEQIPLTILVRNGGYFTVNVEINCEPTDEYMAEWQARTYDTILQASRDRIAEYEDQLKNLKAALQVQVAGKTSEQKQALIKAELEKNCISILSNQHFDSLNAIEFSSFDPDAVPQLFLPNIDPVGRYIRFFQQAFEWDQMMFRYYPYFWGRKKYWNDRLQLDDQDPEFAAFLNAGAARVTIAVRKGYEGAVATFLNGNSQLNLPAGTIPSEADLLAITTGLYVPFFAEMTGADVGPDTALPYGDPPIKWEVRVPTKLVKIRTDNTFPSWSQKTDSNGRVTYEPIPDDTVNP